MIRTLYREKDAFEKEFYTLNDSKKFNQRQFFLFCAILTYALFGILDPLTGTDSVRVLSHLRIGTVVLMSAVWGVFSCAKDYRVREFCILLFALIACASILLMITVAEGPAADFYPFATGVIMIFGGWLVVPQFRTMALVSAVTYASFWGTVWIGETSIYSIYANAFLLTVTTLAVIVGAYNREALERDQLRQQHALSAARDDAERLRDEAIQASKAKSHLLANVSHELRTPMNAIIGFSDVMKAELFGPVRPVKYAEYLDDINRSGKILLANINDLLDISRIEAGKMGWKDTEFAVADAMEIARKASLAAARDGGVAIVANDRTGGLRIRADFDRFCQAIINVLNNAAKFSGSGTEIALTFECTADGRYRLSVADEGCGIPPEDLRRIHEPFVQVSVDGYSSRKGGLGLGLAITREIVRRLEGEIEIESAVGAGTTVRFVLPAHRIAAGPAALRLAG